MSLGVSYNMIQESHKQDLSFCLAKSATDLHNTCRLIRDNEDTTNVNLATIEHYRDVIKRAYNMLNEAYIKMASPKYGEDLED